MLASIETDFANTKTLCNFVELFCFAPPLFLFFKLVSPEFHVSNVAAKKIRKSIVCMFAESNSIHDYIYD